MSQKVLWSEQVRSGLVERSVCFYLPLMQEDDVGYEAFFFFLFFSGRECRTSSGI